MMLAKATDMITRVTTQNGQVLGEWETQHPIRAGEVITDGGQEYEAMFYQGGGLIVRECK